jgi:hypothetical protein
MGGDYEWKSQMAKRHLSSQLLYVDVCRWKIQQIKKKMRSASDLGEKRVLETELEEAITKWKQQVARAKELEEKMKENAQLHKNVTGRSVWDPDSFWNRNRRNDM